MKNYEKLSNKITLDDASDLINHFYGITYSKKNEKDLENYLTTISYRKKGLSASRISQLTNLSKRRVEHWIYGNSMPLIARFLYHFNNLKKPKSRNKWLSLNSTRGSMLSGPWIQVPVKIEDYNDIIEIVRQLNEFDVSKGKELDHLKKENLFAFLLGMIVGDCSKHGIKRKHRLSRRIQLRLSKRYETNEKLGEFTSYCVNILGLRMERKKDCPAARKNTHPFYAWSSQSSSFIQWIFEVCLGLKNNEKTTYDRLRANWLLSTPKNFRISFLQGLAESDGFVDFSSHQIGILSGPNVVLVERILASLGVKSSRKYFSHSKLWSNIITYKDAYNLPVFNPTIRTYRYVQMENLFKAKRISGHWPLWLKKKIQFHIQEGFTGTEIVKKIIEEDEVAIRTKGIRRIKKELEQ